MPGHSEPRTRLRLNARLLLLGLDEQVLDASVRPGWPGFTQVQQRKPTLEHEFVTLEQFLKTHHQAKIRLVPPRCSHCIICIHFLLFNQLVTTIGKLRTRLLVSVPSCPLNCPSSSGWDDWDVFVYHVSTLCEANASYSWAWGGILSSDPSLAQNSRGCCIGDCTADCEEIESEQNSDYGTAS